MQPFVYSTTLLQMLAFHGRILQIKVKVIYHQFKSIIFINGKIKEHSHACNFRDWILSRKHVLFQRQLLPHLIFLLDQKAHQEMIGFSLPLHELFMFENDFKQLKEIRNWHLMTHLCFDRKTFFSAICKRLRSKETYYRFKKM